MTGNDDYRQLLKPRLQQLKLRVCWLNGKRFINVGPRFGQTLLFGQCAGQPEKCGGGLGALELVVERGDGRATIAFGE